MNVNPIRTDDMGLSEDDKVVEFFDTPVVERLEEGEAFFFVEDFIGFQEIFDTPHFEEW